VGLEPLSVAVADLNKDGFLDLATVSQALHNVSVLLGTGTGGFGPATDFFAGLGPQGVAVGDLDGDGFPDVATANRFGNNVSVLLNRLGWRPPVADAGVNQTLIGCPGCLTTVVLNGSGSSDPEGRPLQYQWTEGTTTLATTTDPMKIVTVTLGVGVHTIQLTVTDSQALTSTATVVVDIRDASTLIGATQSSVDALAATLNNLNASASNALDARISSRASQGSVDSLNLTLGAGLDATVSSRASEASLASLRSQRHRQPFFAERSRRLASGREHAAVGWSAGVVTSDTGLRRRIGCAGSGARAAARSDHPDDRSPEGQPEEIASGLVAQGLVDAPEGALRRRVQRLRLGVVVHREPVTDVELVLLALELDEEQGVGQLRDAQAQPLALDHHLHHRAHGRGLL
jgi:hypothetical protein